MDATVLEVGLGGAYDCTNIVPKPVVTAVTSLGLDHVSVLGGTIREIAWQKGGVFKVGFGLIRRNDHHDVLTERSACIYRRTTRRRLGSP